MLRLGLLLVLSIVTASGKSNVFVVRNCPIPEPGATYHSGIDSLLGLLSRLNVPFYKSAKDGPYSGPNGLIGKEDVVMIKVNAEWDQRGMTNTDVLKGLIQRIVLHPDTFTGEVVVVENGQWQFNFDWPQNNAEDKSQSMQKVIDYFSNQGHRVSGSNWTAIGYGSNLRYVNEYETGDENQGYVKEDSTTTSYPKFQTRFGTRISFRRGIWTGAAYDSDHLKLINLPVLKAHRFMGVTGCLKHYVGVLSYTNAGMMHQRLYKNGLLGMMLARTRFPDLNIIDAIWVCGNYTQGPDANYDNTTRVNTIVASTDPVALDGYAGKHVLRPQSFPNPNYDRMDPDNLNGENPGYGSNYSDGTPCFGFPYNAFHQYLFTSRDRLQERGFNVTTDPDSTRVSIFDFNFYISDILSHSITDTSALISWTTNLPATSRVEYGLTADYGFSSPLDTHLVTAHSVILAALEPQTTYHFCVRSKREDEELVSEDRTFTTTIGVGEDKTGIREGVNLRPVSEGLEIMYPMKKSGAVSLKIYDRAGMLVRTLSDGKKNPGTYRLVWDYCDDNRKSLPQGIYLLRLKTDGTQTMKTIIIK